MKLEQLKQYGVVDSKRHDPGETAGHQPAREHIAAAGDAAIGNVDEIAGVVTSRFQAGHLHGPHQLTDLMRVAGSRLAVICKDPEFQFLEVSRAVFLDTETTGLGMGAGTYVFLVGAGYLDGSEFRVEQFFLRGPEDERDYLDDLGSFLASFPAIVTFNGKAFDWPLLENRYILQRKKPPLTDPPHIDLLHAARRLWKARLDSCALSSLEQNVLQIGRTRQDVPGYLIPQLYFDYLQHRDRQILDGVFYHNLQDVLSLAALTVHLDCILENPHAGYLTHPTDYFSLGKSYERADEVESAVECYEEALRCGVAGEYWEQTLVRLGTIYKRSRRYEAALSIWDALCDAEGMVALHARVELAKYYEHVERDYMQAIDQVQNALSLAERFHSDWVDAGRVDLDHRLSRLVNRAVRSRSWVVSGR